MTHVKHFKIKQVNYLEGLVYRICMRKLWFIWSYLTYSYYSPTDPSSYIEFKTEKEALEYINSLNYHTKVLHT